MKLNAFRSIAILAVWLALPQLALAGDPPAGVDPAAALARLKSGNERFVSGKIHHPHTGSEWRSKLITTQHPFATILGCSDSRVSPELLFDQGLGDLFVIRIAGNVIASDVLGTLQYARVHLGCRLLVVMGHDSCGAVSAAVDALAGAPHERAAIEALLKMIEPGLGGVDPKLPRDARIARSVEANVRWSIQQLVGLPTIREDVEKGRVKIVGAIYHLDTGVVRWLD